jgi:hypothetical protein
MYRKIFLQNARFTKMTDFGKRLKSLSLHLKTIVSRNICVLTITLLEDGPTRHELAVSANVRVESWE